MPEKSTEEILEISEDELEREAQSSYVSRTLRRVALTVTDPFRAFRFIGYAPDWGIVLFVIGLLTGLSYLQYYLLFRFKMDIPVAFQSAEVEGVRNFIVNWYFSGAFVATGLSILIGLGIMVVLTRALSGTSAIKQTSIGVIYANIGRVLVTIIMLVIIVLSPAVITPIETAGSGRAVIMVDTPRGKLITTMIVLFNYTVPLDATTVPLPDVQSTMIQGRTDLSVSINYSARVGDEDVLFSTVDSAGIPVNRTSVAINYSSVLVEGYLPIDALSQDVVTTLNWTSPRNVLPRERIGIESTVQIPLNLTYIIPGAENQTLPTWASWVYDSSGRQKILIFKIPVTVSGWVTDGGGRRTHYTTTTVAFFNVTQAPQGLYFSRKFFSGSIPQVFSVLGYFSLIWQALLFAVVARVVNELSWPKAAACSAVYLGITLVMGIL
jgi:hypothetical protein